ncbi:MAG: hypothetical protein ACHQT9_03975 [Candidatus Saccharimonadales bacterium]
MATRGEFPTQLRDEEQTRSDFNRLPYEISMLAALLDDGQRDLRISLQTNIALLSEEFQEPDDQTRALKGFAGTEAQREDILMAFYSEGSYDTETLGVVTTDADRVLRTLLGENYIASCDEEHLRAIRYVRDGHVAATDIVYGGNFYFKPPHEVLVTGDEFPEEQQVVDLENADGLIAKNATVFDPFGVNVFSGDLEMANIKDLFGTYYVLEELPFYETVPEYAIAIDAYSTDNQGGRTQHDFKILAGITMLETDYMRATAIGAIVGGMYIRNPTGPTDR